MLKKCSLAALVLALTVFAAGCGKDESAAGGGGSSTPSGPDLSTPQGAMKALNEAFASMDPAKFEPIHTAEVWKEGKIKKEVDEMKTAGMKIEVTWTDADVKIEGDKCVVSSRMKFTQKDGKVEDEGEKFHLVKVDGKWKFTSK